MNTLHSFFPCHKNSEIKKINQKKCQHQLSQQPQLRRRLVVVIIMYIYHKFYVLVAKNLTLKTLNLFPGDWEYTSFIENDCKISFIYESILLLIIS